MISKGLVDKVCTCTLLFNQPSALMCKQVMHLIQTCLYRSTSDHMAMSFFSGVFRLDQFHIALCLLVGTVVALFVPHVPEDQNFLCALIAVMVNFFPLCAFAWKFVFGLNALLMM